MKDKEIIAVLDEAYEEYEFLDCFRFDISDDLAELICIVKNCDKKIYVGYICMYEDKYSHEYSYKKLLNLCSPKEIIVPKACLLTV